MSEDISKRENIASKIPELDSLYVYKKKTETPFHHREQEGTGYRYKSHNVIYNGGENEIHIYHQTATIDGVIKGLTMVTKNGNEKAVKKWFKEQVKTIESDSKLLAKFKAGKATPSELGIYYLY